MSQDHQQGRQDGVSVTRVDGSLPNPARPRTALEISHAWRFSSFDARGNVVGGHLSLVPEGRGRVHMRIVLRNRANGEHTYHDFHPTAKDGEGRIVEKQGHELAYFEVALYHPGAKNKGIPFDFRNPDTLLHAVQYGQNDALNADDFANWQHGGPVNIVWALAGDQLYLARVRQKRPRLSVLGNEEGWTWALPRGNFDPGQTSTLASADAEVLEELGRFQSKRPRLLPGLSGNQDSSWFAHFTRGPKDGEDGQVHLKGVDAVEREVPLGLLEPDPEIPGNFRFRAGQLGPREDQKLPDALQEIITRLSFFPWEDAADGNDMMSFIAIRLLAQLRREGRLVMVFRR